MSVPSRSTRAAPLAASDAAVARVCRHIDAHLSERLTLDGLAAVAHLSRYHFARTFRRITGASPMEYVLQRRIERARALLRDGRHRIGDIAIDLGFFDQSHFARSFRRATGTPPGRYAREQA